MRLSRPSPIVPFLVALAALLAVVSALWLNSRTPADKSRGSRAASPRAQELKLPAELGAELDRPKHRQLRALRDAACRASQDSCGCLQAEARVALDLDQATSALGLLDASRDACPHEIATGMRAEAKARRGEQNEALTLAQEGLRVNPEDAFALYALGYVAFQRRQDQDAVAWLRQARVSGRGSAAGTLLTLLYYRKNELAAAREASSEILRADPDNVDALYNRALIDQREDHYHAAREGYLRVLKVEPNHPDSRFNLTLLTHRAGALDEARHNLAKLTALVGPNDARVTQLRALFEAQPGAAGEPEPPPQ